MADFVHIYPTPRVDFQHGLLSERADFVHVQDTPVAEFDHIMENQTIETWSILIGN